MSSKRKINKRKKNNNKNRTQKYVLDSRIPTFRTGIVPDAVRTKLVWLDTNNMMNNAGGTFVSKRYRTSGIYDLDPLVGGTAVAGFAEWAAFYQRYRVLHTKVVVHFANYDIATVLQAVLLPLNVDPGATPLLSDIQNWTLQPFAKHTVISRSGGMDRATLAIGFSNRNFVGSDMFLVDDSYSSTVGSVPTNCVYVAVGLMVIGSGITMTTGVGISLTIESVVEFFERKELSV